MLFSGTEGTPKGLTEIDVSGGDQTLSTPSTGAGNPGFGIFTVGGGAIKFDDGFGETFTITFPAWSGLDTGISKVYQTGTDATGIYVGRVS